MVRRKAVGTDMRERAAACYVGCVSSVFLLYTGASGYVAITAAKWYLFEFFPLHMCCFHSISALRRRIQARRAPSLPVLPHQPHSRCLSLRLWLLPRFPPCFPSTPGLHFGAIRGGARGL